MLRRTVAATVALGAFGVACSSHGSSDGPARAAVAPTPVAAVRTGPVQAVPGQPDSATADTGRARQAALPGMPPVTDPGDIYAADRPGMLTGPARRARQLVYVPNSKSNTVDVIDPRTFRIVSHFKVGRLPQHVTPAYDLRRLYVLNDYGNSLTPIDPRTGRPGPRIPVTDPYNLYFTPDGRNAIVVAEARHRLDFRDPHTWRLKRSVPVRCGGVDHADFTADGRYAIFSCEFSGQLLKLDVARQKVLGYLRVKEGGSPQDVKTSPDGKVVYVADQYADGVQLVDPVRFKEIGFIRTGNGTHGLYTSRDSRFLYVSNRHDASVSVVDLRARRAVAKWRVPGMTPDMGGVSEDGRVLWLSGRYDGHVYAISTVTGRLIKRIKVGREPHGLCVWPQPGRYSIGHTGILR